MALKMVTVRIFLLLAVLNSARASGFCKHVVEPLGYGCAGFTVQTRDGFVLALHRLSKTNSLTGISGARSPAGAPVSPPTGDRNVSEASGPAPSPVVLRSNSSIYNSSMLTVELNASAHVQSPMRASEIRGNRSQHSNPAIHSERTTGNGSPSNYTMYPGVRTNSLIPVALHFEFNEFWSNSSVGW